MSVGVWGAVSPPALVVIMVIVVLIFCVIVIVIMECDSPQLLMDGGSVPCGICLLCYKSKENANRQRRFYWAKRRKGASHG